METPILAATGAIYFIAMPRSVMSALVSIEAFANTSATRPDCSADSPKPFSAEAAISAVVARSVCPAAAKSRRPGIAAMMSFVLNPACARRACASAAWLALNTVLEPRAIAWLRNASNSAPVACEIALTFAIDCSNVRDVSIAFAMTAPIAIASAP
ncbi:hypothetical protein D1872_226720 [compost metagenome]